MAIGVDTLTSLVRHQILPEITDNIYTKNNALLYRIINSMKMMVQGGTTLEYPLISKDMTGGGTYNGFDELTIDPQDTIQNGLLQWKQYYQGFAVDGRTLNIADSPLAVANLIETQREQVFMRLSNLLAQGVWSNGTTDPLAITGLQAVLSTSNTYAGIDRSTTANAWWRASIDSSTTALSFTAMRGIMGTATQGASAPTVIFGNRTNYNRFYALGANTTGYAVNQVRQPGGQDEMLLQAGFTNLMFENIPFIVDDNITANTDIYFLNERYLKLAVTPRGDFVMTPWQRPTKQDGYLCYLKWMGQLICQQSKTQGKLSAITS